MGEKQKDVLTIGHRTMVKNSCHTWNHISCFSRFGAVNLMLRLVVWTKRLTLCASELWPPEPSFDIWNTARMEANAGGKGKCQRVGTSFNIYQFGKSRSKRPWVISLTTLCLLFPGTFSARVAHRPIHGFVIGMNPDIAFVSLFAHHVRHTSPGILPQIITDHGLSDALDHGWGC